MDDGDWNGPGLAITTFVAVSMTAKLPTLRLLATYNREPSGDMANAPGSLISGAELITVRMFCVAVSITKTLSVMLLETYSRDPSGINANRKAPVTPEIVDVTAFVAVEMTETVPA